MLLVLGCMLAGFFLLGLVLIASFPLLKFYDWRRRNDKRVSENDWPDF